MDNAIHRWITLVEFFPFSVFLFKFFIFYATVEKPRKILVHLPTFLINLPTDLSTEKTGFSTVSKIDETLLFSGENEIKKTLSTIPQPPTTNTTL